MKVLDYIILFICVPMLSLASLAKLRAIQHPLYSTGIVKTRFKTAEVLLFIGGVLFVVYRRWG